MTSTLVNKRVLVTGASGFIGSHLCHRLVKEDAVVHAISRTTQLSLSSGIHHLQADISDYDSAHRVFVQAKPDIIFHLAGYVQGSRDLEHARPALYGNLVTTVNLLTVAAEIGCERIVLTGSQDEPDPDEATADTFVPPSPYAASKLAANSYARMFHALYQLPVSVARIYMAYGPAQRDLNKLIPYVILSLLRGQTPRLSSGTRPMDWIYVDDVVDGMIATAQSRTVDGQTIGLGTGIAHTAHDAATKIVTLMAPGATLAAGAMPDRPMEKARLGNVAETRAKIDWQPAISFDEGLRRTVEWYRNQIATGSITV